MKIGITGATGQLGRIIVEKLRSNSSGDVVALVRDPQKAADLGVEVRLADYDRPETLISALKGIDILLLISANEIGKRAEQHKRVLEAAKANGVGRIVYTRLLRADTSSLSLAREHFETEEMIKASGIPFTILRNGWYTENYTGSTGGALAGGAFLGSAGAGKISSASREDYAEAAVAVLTQEGHSGRTYELAGDTSYTLADLAQELSRQTGRDIPYRDLPQQEYAAALEGFGVPAHFAAAIDGWDVSASEGALASNDRTLSNLIGRTTTPMPETVGAALRSL
jgi:NAD(P)H dehydrogenase (quinone)